MEIFCSSFYRQTLIRLSYILKRFHSNVMLMFREGNNGGVL